MQSSTKAFSRPLSQNEKPGFSWLTDPSLQKLCKALQENHPDSVKFVGGCVRDSLFGIPCYDFDVATSHKPNNVIKILDAVNIKTYPTGIEHGTITARINSLNVEVTSLRRDISTDGRRATISYTDDWVADAKRRDFTVNALYLSPDGVLLDPVDGLTDLAKRRIAFIGDPKTRIREDYLRILRFFRFSVRFSDGFDQAGLDAITELGEGIEQLSRERIGDEVLKILSLSDASKAIEAIIATGITPYLWPGECVPSLLLSLKKLVQEQWENETALKLDIVKKHVEDPILALSALLNLNHDGLAKRLRLSNRQKDRLDFLTSDIDYYQSLSGYKDKDHSKNFAHQNRSLIYHMGHNRFLDMVLYLLAAGKITKPNAEAMMAISFNWVAPQFPVSGQMLLDLGMKPGPDISRYLSVIEGQWVEMDFPPDEIVFDIAKKIVATGL